MSKKNYIVDHPRTYLAVDGKLQHVPKGTPLTLTDDQAKGLGKRVVPAGQEQAVDLTNSSEEAAAKAKAEAEAQAAAELEQLRAKATELNIQNAANLDEAQLKAEIEAAEKAIADANNALNS